MEEGDLYMDSLEQMIRSIVRDEIHTCLSKYGLLKQQPETITAQQEAPIEKSHKNEVNETLEVPEKSWAEQEAEWEREYQRRCEELRELNKRYTKEVQQYGDRLKIQDVAKIMKIGKQSVYKLIKEDPTFPSAKLSNGMNLIHTSEFFAWLYNDNGGK